MARFEEQYVVVSIGHGRDAAPQSHSVGMKGKVLDAYNLRLLWNSRQNVL